MRDRLSQLLCDAASNRPDVIVLSGDHGYSLFDQIRTQHPRCFLNVGVTEQAMIGYASGLCKVGFFPIVYGLASFVPIRVLEQIKLDLCLSKAPSIILGDGAGLVYSTLGNSHHCAEDIAALRPLPHIRIYSPCDKMELSVCFAEALTYAGPSYIRIGKCDRPVVHSSPLQNTDCHITTASSRKKTCLISTGSMVSIADRIAQKHDFLSISVPRIKPFDHAIDQMIGDCGTVFVLEEHSRHGGLGSCIAECLCEHRRTIPHLHVLSLKERFAQHCGSHQYALSEHDLSDAQIEAEILRISSD